MACVSVCASERVGQLSEHVRQLAYPEVLLPGGVIFFYHCYWLQQSRHDHVLEMGRGFDDRVRRMFG
jgi:hypothetical protein